MSPQKTVEGLTEGAFRSDSDTIFFRVDDQILLTLANFEDDPRTAEWVLELAKRAVAALEAR